jgi:hypothetical protein
MNKVYFTLIIAVIALASSAQTAKCPYKVYVDEKAVGKEVVLNKIVSNLNPKDESKLTENKTGIWVGKRMVNTADLDTIFSKWCSIKPYVLESVTIFRTSLKKDEYTIRLTYEKIE